MFVENKGAQNPGEVAELPTSLLLEVQFATAKQTVFRSRSGSMASNSDRQKPAQASVSRTGTDSLLARTTVVPAHFLLLEEKGMARLARESYVLFRFPHFSEDMNRHRLPYLNFLSPVSLDRSALSALMAFESD